MRRVVNFCDYFVVISASSERHAQAIASGIEEGLLECGLKVRYKEGLKSSKWILVDLGDVVTHIFETEVREFYGLEHLWQDAPRVNWQKKSTLRLRSGLTLSEIEESKPKSSKTSNRT